jgi:hypothetical protein
MSLHKDGKKVDDDEKDRRLRSSSFQFYSFLRSVVLTIVCTLSVPLYTMLLCMMAYCGAIYLARDIWWLRNLLLLYTPYYLLLDKTPTTGARWFSKHREWLRHFPGFHAMASYFPVGLHKTCDLKPSTPYIFLYHRTLLELTSAASESFIHPSIALTHSFVVPSPRRYRYGHQHSAQHEWLRL